MSDTGGKPRSTAFDGDWERLWLSLTGPWTSLAVVPTEPGGDAVKVARGLVAVGQRSMPHAVRLVNAAGAQLEDVEEVLETVQAITARGELVVISVDPILSCPAALPIIRATSGAVLVVRIKESHLSSARNTARAIGNAWIVGSVVLG